jgi:predicted dehydrogenase
MQITSGSGGWEDIALETGQPEKNYMNPEQPYQAEMRDFLSAVSTGQPTAYTFRDDSRVLEILYAIERDAAHAQPTAVPE